MTQQSLVSIEHPAASAEQTKTSHSKQIAGQSGMHSGLKPMGDTQPTVHRRRKYSASFFFLDGLLALVREPHFSRILP